MEPFIGLSSTKGPTKLFRQAEYPSVPGQPKLRDVGDRTDKSIGRFRVGVVTMKGRLWELEDNFRRMEGYVRQAVRDKAQVVITPETVLDGYVCADDPNTTRTRMLTVAQTVPDGPYVVRARKLAHELDIYLIFGFLERVDEDMYNSCVLISSQGRVIAKYSKVHPKDESHVRAGRKLASFDTPLGRVGFLICSDRRVVNFPPLLAAGAQLIFLPIDGNGGPDNTEKMKRRGQISWIVIANTSSAVVIDPLGKVLMEHYDVEGANVQDVDLSSVSAAKNRPVLSEAELENMVRKAVEATQNRWDMEGYPTQFEIDGRKKHADQFLTTTHVLAHAAEQLQSVSSSPALPRLVL